MFIAIDGRWFAVFSTPESVIWLSFGYPKGKLWATVRKFTSLTWCSPIISLYLTWSEGLEGLIQDLNLGSSTNMYKQFTRVMNIIGAFGSNPVGFRGKALLNQRLEWFQRSRNIYSDTFLICCSSLIVD